MVAQVDFTWRNLQLKNSETAAELHILDEIGAGWFGGVTVKDFADAMAKAKGRPLDVFINSPGGSVTDGISMFNMLARHDNRVHSYIIGEAASIASVIPQASDRVFASANTLMMIHDPWAMDAGNSRDKRKLADLLDMAKGQILDSYLARATASRQELDDLMAAETWLTAEQAMALGLIDEIVDLGRDTSARASLARFDGVYQHIPANRLTASRAAREALPLAERRETYLEHTRSTIIDMKESDLKLILRIQRREMEQKIADVVDPPTYENKLRRDINALKKGM